MKNRLLQMDALPVQSILMLCTGKLSVRLVIIVQEAVEPRDLREAGRQDLVPGAACS